MAFFEESLKMWAFHSKMAVKISKEEIVFDNLHIHNMKQLKKFFYKKSSESEKSTFIS